MKIHILDHAEDNLVDGYNFGDFIKSNGSVLSTNPFWIEIQAPDMEVDGLNVSRFVAKAATPDFEALDAALHTLRHPVACLQYDGIENA